MPSLLVRRSSRRSARTGFTIIELLVATSITLALAAMLVAMTSNVLDGWRRSTGRLSAESQARVLLDQLERDLAGFVYRPDGNCYMAATVLTGSGNSPNWVNPFDPLGQVASGDLPFKFTGAGSEEQDVGVADGPGHRNVWLQHGNRTVVTDLPITSQRFGMAGTWLRFFSMAPDGAPAGTVAAVSYQVVRRAISSSPDAEVRWLLHRHVVRPYTDVATNRPGVLEAGLNLWPDNASLYDAQSPGGNNDAELGTADPNGIGLADPITVRRTRPENVIANNVIDFGVRFYKRQGGILVLMFPATQNSSTGANFSSGRINMDSYRGVGADGTPATSDDIGLDLRFANGPGTPGNGDIAHFVSSRVAPALLPATARNLYAGQVPDVVEIMVRILTEEGARQIAALESGRLGITPPDGLGANTQGRAEWWWRIADANSVVFTRQIDLKSRSF
jgi:type II secretory pathway pseudopilin PulG